ncbi:MAG: hypothetical protein ACT4PV_00720 [Planctomycetaceae bacterium]
MDTTHRSFLALLAALAAFAATAAAVETVTYAHPDGGLRSAEVLAVTKDDLKEFSARIKEGGKRQTLTIPSRLVAAYRLGDDEASNPWSKRLSKAYRLLAEGNLVTKDNVPGAEELFTSIAYSTEKGVPGQVEPIEPWHNMYALFHLIVTHYEVGRGGDKARLERGLKEVDQFVQRSEKPRGRTMDFDVPFTDRGVEGVRKAKIFSWGDSRLVPEVLLYKARMLRELGQTTEAAAAFEAVAEFVKKNDLSPTVLCAAVLEKADMESVGKASEAAEGILRAAGNRLRIEVTRQKEPWSQSVVSQAANRALLRGADLLLASAEEKKVSFDVPLEKYQQLQEGPGKDDPFLMTGSSAGIGICLYEKGEGERAYKVLLRVAVLGREHPEQVARALYYLGFAAPRYADEIDRTGGSGEIARAEGRRWWNDLVEQFPQSPWAKKVPAGK